MNLSKYSYMPLRTRLSMGIKMRFETFITFLFAREKGPNLQPRQTLRTRCGACYFVGKKH